MSVIRKDVATPVITNKLCCTVNTHAKCPCGFRICYPCLDKVPNAEWRDPNVDHKTIMRCPACNTYPKWEEVW